MHRFLYKSGLAWEISARQMIQGEKIQRLISIRDRKVRKVPWRVRRLPHVEQKPETLLVIGQCGQNLCPLPPKTAVVAMANDDECLVWGQGLYRPPSHSGVTVRHCTRKESAGVWSMVDIHCPLSSGRSQCFYVSRDQNSDILRSWLSQRFVLGQFAFQSLNWRKYCWGRCFASVHKVWWVVCFANS